ncbi:unnamed protein product [Somion occarium]|uniref:C2H2-type domain-containing protein n=1 Tax=Somion occarium TaxID=3059160 RepID=A0ABP1DJW9_9APHY
MPKTRRARRNDASLPYTRKNPTQDAARASLEYTISLSEATLLKATRQRQQSLLIQHGRDPNLYSPENLFHRPPKTTNTQKDLKPEEKKIACTLCENSAVKQKGSKAWKTQPISVDDRSRGRHCYGHQAHWEALARVLSIDPHELQAYWGCPVPGCSTTMFVVRLEGIKSHFKTHREEELEALLGKTLECCGHKFQVIKKAKGRQSSTSSSSAVKTGVIPVSQHEDHPSSSSSPSSSRLSPSPPSSFSGSFSFSSPSPSTSSIAPEINLNSSDWQFFTKTTTTPGPVSTPAPPTTPSLSPDSSPSDFASSVDTSPGSPDDSSLGSILSAPTASTSGEDYYTPISNSELFEYSQTSASSSFTWDDSLLDPSYFQIDEQMDAIYRAERSIVPSSFLVDQVCYDNAFDDPFNDYEPVLITRY